MILPIGVRKIFTNIYSALAVYLIIVTAGLCIKSFVSLDTSETLYWGIEWQMGYYKHPPLFAWICAAFAKVFGYKAIWMYHMLGVLPKIISSIYIYHLAKDVLLKSERAANVEVLSVASALFVLTSFYFIPLAKYNGNSLLFIFWPAIIYHSYRIIFHESVYQYIIYGLYCGLAMLAKYYNAIIILSSFIIVVSMKPAALRKPMLYVAVLLAVAIFAPHVIWLFEHKFISAEYVMNKGDSENRLLGLLFVMLKNVAMNSIFLFAVWRERFTITKQNSPELKFLLLSFIIPIGMNYSYALLGRYMNTFWMSPCFEILPLVYFMGTRPKNTLNWKSVTFGCILFSLVVVYATDIAERFQGIAHTRKVWNEAAEMKRVHPEIDCVTGMHSKEMGIAFMQAMPNAHVYLVENNCNVVHPNRNVDQSEEHTCILVHNNEITFLGKVKIKDLCTPTI